MGRMMLRRLAVAWAIALAALAPVQPQLIHGAPSAPQIRLVQLEAQAQSRLLGSGSGSPSNIDTSYEFGGFSATGTGKQVATNAAATNKGPWEELIASTSGSWAGFWLEINIANTSGNRFLLDIGVGAAGSEVVKVPDLFVSLGATTAGPLIVFVPLNVASSQRVAARVSSNGASGSSLYITVIGVLRTASHSPLFDDCERITTAPAGTPATAFPSSTDITGVTSAGTGWTVLNASTSRTYGALLSNLGLRTSGAAPGNAQQLTFRLATGAAASEALFFQAMSATSTSAPYVQKFPILPIYKSFPSGTRIAGEVLAANSDVFSPQIIGCY